MRLNLDNDYGELVRAVLTEGETRQTRNGKTNSLFGQSLTVDMSDSDEFPLLVGRKMYPSGILGELAALLRQPKHVKDFEAFGCNYWKKWADENGNLTLDYGNSWFDLNGVNQFDRLITTLRDDPTDRRLIITSWRPDRLDELSLPCCHHTYQWYVRAGEYLDMLWIQRSVDVMIGLPSDIVFAAAWNIMIANEVGLKPGKLTFSLGDTHIYEEHTRGALEYLSRIPLFSGYPTYQLLTAPGTPTQSFVPEMLLLTDYKPKDPIKFLLKE